MISVFCTEVNCGVVRGIFPEMTLFTVFQDREVLCGGMLNSANLWGCEIAAAQCALKTSSLRALLNLWQRDSIACSSLLFRTHVLDNTCKVVLVTEQDRRIVVVQHFSKRNHTT